MPSNPLLPGSTLSFPGPLKNPRKGFRRDTALEEKEKQRLKKQRSSYGVFFLFVCFTEWLEKHSRSHTRTPSQRLRQESSSLFSLSPSVTPASSLPAHLLQLPPPSPPSLYSRSLSPSDKMQTSPLPPSSAHYFQTFSTAAHTFCQNQCQLQVPRAERFHTKAFQVEKDKSTGQSLIHLKHHMPWLMNNANEAFSAGFLFKALTATFTLIRLHSYLSVLLHVPLLWVPRACLTPFCSHSSERHVKGIPRVSVC